MQRQGDFIICTEEELQNAIIAQNDDNDYQESGWLAFCFSDDVCGLIAYSHNSCYGTWESITENDHENTIYPNWIGTKEQLIKMAKQQIDPDMYGRKIDPNEDYDADHLLNVYKEILNNI